TASFRPVDAFMNLTGTRVGLVLYYSAWNDPFQTRFAGWAHARHALPMVQMEPRGVALAGIAAQHHARRHRHGLVRLRRQARRLPARTRSSRTRDVPPRVEAFPVDASRANRRNAAGPPAAS